jgi:hypothetical protein
MATSGNPNIVYAAPTGDDANDGLSWETAKKTIDAAYDALLAVGSPLSEVGGGELHFAEGTAGHLWIRGDGLSVPGWKPQCPLRLIGHGKSSSSFATNVQAMLFPNQPGFAPDFKNRLIAPPFWFVNIGFPITLENYVPQGGGCMQILRAGWDYLRSRSVSSPIDPNPIDLQAITSWERNISTSPVLVPGSSTVEVATSKLTVELGPGIEVTKATRVGDIVTLTYVDVYPQLYPLSYQQVIKFTSTNETDFPSGEFTVIGGTEGRTSLQYIQPNAFQGTIADAGNWQAHGASPRDRIEVVSTSAEVVSTAYRVVATTATTITVADYYGGTGTRSASILVANPGQYVVQQRNQYTAVGSLTITNFGAFTIVDDCGDNVGRAGPALDFGTTADSRELIKETSITGGVYPGQILDPDRAAWLLFDGGANSSIGGMIKDCRPGPGGVRVYGNTIGTWILSADNVVADIEVDFHDPVPCIEIIEGGPSGFFTARRCINTDNSGINVKVDELMDPSSISLIDCGGVAGPANVAGMSQWLGTLWSTQTRSPIAERQVLTGWADQRVSGKHPGTYRSTMGLTSARFQNLLPPPGQWSGFGGLGTVTGGQADPKGGTDGYLLTNTAGTPSRMNLVTPSSFFGTTEIGDRWALGAWMRRDGGLDGRSYLQAVMDGSANNFIVNGLPRFLGDGEWQWVVGATTVTDDSTPSVGTSVYVLVFDEVVIYQPTLIRVPASVGLTDNEWAEYILTLRDQPPYLLPGTTGTPADVKLIAHGGVGFGPSARTGDGGSALNVLTKKVKAFDESGKLLGYIDVGFSLPISQVAAWYKADLLTGNDEDLVSTWPDSSGNGNNATQATSGKKPKLRTGPNGQGGYNTVEFDGVDDFMGASVNPGSTGLTILYAAKNTQVGDTSGGFFFSTVISVDEGSDAKWTFRLCNNSMGQVGPSGAIDLGNASGLVVQGYSQAYKTDKTAWNMKGVYVAGPVSDTSFPGNPATITIGDRYDRAGAVPFKGPIFEVVVFSGVLSDGDISAWLDYLNAKWGI